MEAGGWRPLAPASLIAVTGSTAPGRHLEVALTWPFSADSPVLAAGVLSENEVSVLRIPALFTWTGRAAGALA